MNLFATKCVLRREVSNTASIYNSKLFKPAKLGEWKGHTVDVFPDNKLFRLVNRCFSFFGYDVFIRFVSEDTSYLVTKSSLMNFIAFESFPAEGEGTLSKEQAIKIAKVWDKVSLDFKKFSRCFAPEQKAEGVSELAFAHWKHIQDDRNVKRSDSSNFSRMPTFRTRHELDSSFKKELAKLKEELSKLQESPAELEKKLELDKEAIEQQYKNLQQKIDTEKDTIEKRKADVLLRMDKAKLPEEVIARIQNRLKDFDADIAKLSQEAEKLLREKSEKIIQADLILAIGQSDIERKVSYLAQSIAFLESRTIDFKKATLGLFVDHYAREAIYSAVHHHANTEFQALSNDLVMRSLKTEEAQLRKDFDDIKALRALQASKNSYSGMSFDQLHKLHELAAVSLNELKEEYRKIIKGLNGLRKLSQTDLKDVKKQRKIYQKDLKDIRKEMKGWEAEIASLRVAELPHNLDLLERILKSWNSAETFVNAFEPVNKNVDLDVEQLFPQNKTATKIAVSFAEELNKEFFLWTGNFEEAEAKGLSKNAIERAEALNDIFGKDVTKDLVEMPLEEITINGKKITEGNGYTHALNLAKEMLESARKNDDATLQCKMNAWIQALIFTVIIDALDRLATDYVVQVQQQISRSMAKQLACGLVNQEWLSFLVPGLSAMLTEHEKYNLPEIDCPLTDVKRGFDFSLEIDRMKLKTSIEATFKVPQEDKTLLITGEHLRLNPINQQDGQDAMIAGKGVYRSILSKTLS